MAHPPAAAPIAFLSDLHGNLAALEVVLAELDRLGVKRLYVAGDLYEEDDIETGIRLGASPTRDGAPSPPRVQAMEVDSGTRTLRTVMRGLFGDVLELLKDATHFQRQRVKNESVIFSSPPPE